MPEDLQKAGPASEADGTDAAVDAAAGTTEGKGRDAAMGSEDIAKLNQEWRTEVERLRKANAELEARMQQPPAAGNEQDPRSRRLQAVRQYADRDDPVAQEILELRDEQERLVQEIGFAQQLRDIPDKKLRSEVLDHFQKNRNRFGDPNAALSDIRAVQLEQENTRLRAEIERASKVSGSDVVRTDTREVPASEHKTRKMTGAQFDEAQATLRAQGNHAAARAMQRDYAEGKIDVD